MLKQFFLHEWRRHVCRDCTGHLAPWVELLARMREPRKETQPNTTNNPKNHLATGFLLVVADGFAQVLSVLLQFLQVGLQHLLAI